MSYLLE